MIVVEHFLSLIAGIGKSILEKSRPLLQMLPPQKPEITRFNDLN
jgi:hypothetical protein